MVPVLHTIVYIALCVESISIGESVWTCGMMIPVAQLTLPN